MTLTQLKYVLAVDRCRNFAQAARESYVTQPTLSAQIHKLEDHLQVCLFDRSKVPVTPTVVGEKIILMARKVIEEANKLEEFSKSLRGELSGEFILAIIPTVAPYVIPLFTYHFMKKFPDIQLKIYEFQTDVILAKLKDGTIDGAILATPLESKDIVEEHLFYEPFNVFFSPEHPALKKKYIREQDLNLREAWLLKEGHCLRSQALNICQSHQENPSHNIFFEGGSLETLVQIVRKTPFSFTILPALASLNLSVQDQKLVRAFKNTLPVRKISLITGPHSVKESIKNELVQIVRDLIPKELKKEKKGQDIIHIY